MMMRKGGKVQGSSPKGSRNGAGLLPNSFRLISSCLKSVSTNATTVASTVRLAGASVAASISVADDEREQVQWAGFDTLELSPSASRHVLLLGYSNGFQVVDVEDASNVRELVSKRDGPVKFLQMQPFPAKSEGHGGFRVSHPLLLVVAGEETSSTGLAQGGLLSGPVRDGTSEPQPGNCISTPTVVRFYSLRSHSYVHVLRFRSSVYAIRCSPRIVAVALAAQIYCFDAVTLENKFSVLAYPIPQGSGQGVLGVNIGYGPMAVGPRWLAYAPNHALMSNTGRLSPQNLSPSPGVSPSTSPGSGSLVARYAMESSKHLAAGIISLSDRGYKTLSKYCQELLPDGSSSPVSPNSSWKMVKVTLAAHPSEPDNAGMVAVRDFVSKAIIAQFRAHTSPISALCFDPSGTLLVTASVNGNNINVFRIMPPCTQNGASAARHDWSASHVHLYKLYRGLTTAVIQDICFSNYSNWVAIVSSKGTCHIFVLSPFGGDLDLHTLSVRGDGSTLLPSLSLPWWTTSGSCVLNQQNLPPPPPPITLAVVSRIKNGNYGWLSTVSNVAASATGKISVPSGAVAATFHNSVHHDLQQDRSKANSLEHLLVYSPSGHLIQHDLLPMSGIESSDSTLRNGPASSGPPQDEEFRVQVESIQWWDVCRRSNWPEREESLSSIGFDRTKTNRISMDISDSDDNEAKFLKPFSTEVVEKELVKAHERSHWYLSNAEVQINLGRIPIWQKPKIGFYVMDPAAAKEWKFAKDFSSGEIEIEKVLVHEVEIRRKDLLPVFEHFHQLDWSGRVLVGGRCPSSSSFKVHQTKDKLMEETVIRRFASRESVESSNVGLSRTPGDLLDLDQTSSSWPDELHPFQKPMNPLSSRSLSQSRYSVNKIDGQRRDNAISPMPQLGVSAGSPSKSAASQDNLSFCSGHANDGDSQLDGCVGDGFSPSGSQLHYFSNASGPNHSSSNVHAEELESVDLNNGRDFGQYFHEGYCKISEVDDCNGLAEGATDADSASSQCERERPEEDGDNDDMLGGVFAFCEEGLTET